MADRPTPLREVASWWGTLHGLIAGVITTLVTMGILSTQQQSLYDNGLTSVDALVTAIVGVVSAAMPIIASVVSAKAGERHVTPVSDPHTIIDGKLVPLVPKGNGRHEA
jgi:hypothetical protein